MFNKILIAHRAEIAVRIIRACHELGVTAVAVYSEVDKTTMHVREADEAYLIGPAAPAESYLNQQVLIETARNAGCQAVHPGYGFLAENAEFAQAVADAGLVFIGSSPESIKLLGNKVASRQTMAEAGVPIIPGTKTGSKLDDKTLTKEADRIGFPVLVKAAAGGGGKGMRIVEDPADLKAALEAARREAKAAFGDQTVFLEKYLVEPRHIEFQVFGDAFGNRVHLFERECSIQRRHQKIIEETPSTALDDELRRRMGETAVKVVKAAGYWNAGTVEFLLDKDRNFYFLEVNTRIQVEHPVTEETVGVDLVREQILVAAGRELSWKQDELSQRGHAIECRIYAEDASANFLPSAGPVHLMREPRGPGIRFDGGVESGDEVSVHYDPIIAKLICTASDRAAAVRRMRLALDETVILGLTTNIEFLKAVMERPAFLEGRLNTGF
ncbi:MAG TPA: acetyl-CoA carboxylase biotin carboxylase subunit, partial [Bacteroidetes bacterium]|nr:acetyl-CoA carboxylase biotin carboxylase subunit [Bacteroidota bacterium]